MSFLLNPYSYGIFYSLGTESAVDSADGSGESGSVSSTASFTFNTNGTVTAVSGVTSPYTNWNTFGGTHISYRIISSSTTGLAGFSAPMAASDDGSVRIQVNAARSFTASASASASQAAGNGGGYEEGASRIIEIWVWDAGSGGTILAKGKYTISAAASFAYTGEPL